jgi:cysteine synthase
MKDLAGKGGEDYVSPNQYENPLNAMAHYKSTGPEIWKQTEGKVNYFFAGFGTCGTISGVGKYLKEQNPDVKIIGVEPKSRNHNLAGMKKISNLPEELIPNILNRDVIDDIVEVEDDQAYQTAIDLARKTGILMGPTTGAVLFSALKHSKDNQGLAVVIAPDDAFKYVSLFADYLKD